MATEAEKLLQVNQNILSCAECPVCTEYMVAPILQCSAGHSICSGCKEKLEKCPICSGPVTGPRNFSLENMIENLTFPCSNSEFGCKDMIFINDKVKHGRTCPYRLYDCFRGTINDCLWRGRKQDILAHMQEEHDEYITKEEKACFYYSTDFSFDSLESELISAHGEIFRLQHFVDASEKTFYVSVHFIGPQEYCSKYSYTVSCISDIDSDSQPKIIFTAQTHPDYIEEVVKENVPCFSIRQCVAKYFLDCFETIEYSIQIIENM